MAITGLEIPMMFKEVCGSRGVHVGGDQIH